MEELDILKIDDRGRIAIPLSIREMLDLLGKKEPRLLVTWTQSEKELKLRFLDPALKHLDINKLKLQLELKSKEKFKILKIDKGGRIGLTKLLRDHLELEKYSYIMAISKPTEKNTILKKAMVLQIKIKDTYEWRVICPIPENLDVYEKMLREQHNIDNIQFFMTDPYYEKKKVLERKLTHLLSD